MFTSGAPLPNVTAVSIHSVTLAFTSPLAVAAATATLRKVVVLTLGTPAVAAVTRVPSQFSTLISGRPLDRTTAVSKNSTVFTSGTPVVAGVGAIPAVWWVTSTSGTPVTP